MHQNQIRKGETADSIAPRTRRIIIRILERVPAPEPAGMRILQRKSHSPLLGKGRIPRKKKKNSPTDTNHKLKHGQMVYGLKRICLFLFVNFPAPLPLDVSYIGGFHVHWDLCVCAWVFQPDQGV